MFATYEADDYKERFGAIDQLRPIRSAAEIEQLNERLVEDLRERRLDNIHLAPPEITDWMDHDGFHLSTVRDQEQPDPDPSIRKYLDSLRNAASLSFAKLKRDHVEAVDAASGFARRRWTVYACLVYDTRVDGHLAVLSGGQWFRVSESLDEEIVGFVKGLPDTDLQLPDAPLRIEEDDYNALAAETIGAVCTHTELVRVKGRDPVELCDLLTADRKFVHIKRRGASSTLSHLFAQGLISAELFLDDQPYRDAAAEVVAQLGGQANMLPTERPTPGDWEIAYVVITRGRRRDDSPYTLPFFSLANLASSAKRLQDRGLKVSVAEVREG